jgi:hypothetical protein
LSALAPSVLRDRPVAAVGTFFTPNSISCHRSRCSKSTSNRAAIYATTTPNIIASLTSLNNTGARRSFDSVLLAVRGPLTRCRGRCWGVLMTSPSNRFEGAPSLIFYFRTELGTSLQICKQVRAVYFRLSSRLVGCPSSVGQQTIPRSSHSPPGYGRAGEGNGPKVDSFISWVYIHACCAVAPSTSAIRMSSRKFCPVHVT